MDSAAIKELLRGLPRAEDLSIPAGFLAIRRRAVTDAGAHVSAVEQWVYSHGGSLTPAPDPILSGIAQWRSEHSRDAIAYVIPAACLD